MLRQTFGHAQDLDQKLHHKAFQILEGHNFGISLIERQVVAEKGLLFLRFSLFDVSSLI